MNELLIAPENKIIFAIWFFLTGLCIGSFLNVVILRGLSNESIVFPASKCPKCGNKLKWWMNIPVLSYILIKGKCRYCKEPVSIQYPVVEFITGLFFLLIFLKFNLSAQTFFYITGFSIFTVMAVTDIKESVIFDLHAYLLIITGLIFNSLPFYDSPGFLGSLGGGAVGFILYEIMARSGYIFAGQRAFGEGDSLIAAGIGAFFGWKMVIVSSFISVILMAVCVLPYFLIHSYETGKKKTVFALIVSIFLIMTAFLVSKLKMIKTFEEAMIFLIVIITGAILCAYFIIDDMKKKDEEGNLELFVLPFGPSMMVSFILIMFFEKEIEGFINTYLSAIS